MITDSEIQFESFRMSFEKKYAGKILSVGNGESEVFWNDLRYKAGNRWWKFWDRKSDFEIMKMIILL